MKFVFKFLLVLSIGLLIYSRFVNISWGLPYPFHPDERNMANAIQSLHCDSKLIDCFNPHFYAYGQLPLYLTYTGIQAFHFLEGRFGDMITFTEATIGLRLLSALASIINVFIILKTIGLFHSVKGKKMSLISILLIIFSPYFIQFAHFGTTESLLMLFYTMIVYYSLRILIVKNNKIKLREICTIALFCGLSIATKISSIIFIAPPLLVLITNYKLRIRNVRDLVKYFFQVICFLLLIALVSIIFSPHNIISWTEFISSIQYESSVATGAVKVFYTRQFENTIPVVFQFVHIFPYALGWPIFLLSVCGFILLPFNKMFNLLRISILFYFIPSAFLYTKWTRFMAPILPLVTIMAILMIFKLKGMINNVLITNYFIFFIAIVSIIPGLAFLSVYQQEDVRFTASQWIYQHIPAETTILSETANVVDIPIPSPNDPNERVQSYTQYHSFNFYDLDQDTNLQEELKIFLPQSNYIFIPSRRIFANINCDKNTCSYPLLNQYYSRLFSGVSGFKQVAEFTSYPKITLFGKTIYEFSDENAEETWTVFDHPVIRIYKRI